jgi:acetyl-CoA carboxylase biotin carboxylase subunit
MSAKFRKVLVANRGEISLRVQQALREEGITACAVYSEPDRAALHTIRADEAYPIGPGPSRESYLDFQRLLDAAKQAKADAIHPGYGFLSENAEFAAAVEAAGLVFIGPTPESMRSMGNKLAARRAMTKAKVPVVPGLVDPIDDLESARKAAKQIGYPVLLKAAAGGGGKGMRVVRSEKELESALSRTRGESKSAFGDDSVYVEKYLERPRHIEVQVMGDTHGNLVHCFERECSVQRRHQKVIEESPSPSIDDKLRQKLCTAAVSAARAVSYRGAGTVEFIVDEDGSFYFLEMNTRLQVEHPITEEVVGIDLVRAQLRVAQGQKLPWAQEQLQQRGHAIEFRIYAEDPWNDFAPSIGKVLRLRVPSGAGIRNDIGIREGYEIPIFYDPMLAKLIVHGESREVAIARGRRALEDYRILGFAYNKALHLWVLQQKEFLSGHYSTKFLQERFRSTELDSTLPERSRESLAAALALVESGVGDARESGGTLPPELSPWGQIGRAHMQGKNTRI